MHAEEKTEELKPCPFCGWKLEWGDGNSKEPACPESGMFEGEEIYTIACPDCGAGVAPGHTLEEVIGNWNRRAGSLAQHRTTRQVRHTNAKSVGIQSLGWLHIVQIVVTLIRYSARWLKRCLQ